MARLLVLAQGIGGILHHVPRVHQLPVHAEPLFEADLAFLFQSSDRVAAFGEATVQFGAVPFQLFVLGVHARERLFQRGQRDAPGFHRDRVAMRDIGSFLRVRAGSFAAFQQLPAFGFQRDAGLLVFTHAGDGSLHAGARGLQQLFVLGERGFDSGVFGIDRGKPRSRTVDAALPALHLAGQLGQPTVRVVHVPLRVVARLFGSAPQVTHFRLAFLKLGDALVDRRELGGGFLQFALAGQYADLAAFGATNARKTRPEPDAIAGDDGVRGRECRRDRARLVQRGGGANLRQQRARRGRTRHRGGKRAGHIRVQRFATADQGDVGFLDAGEVLGQ